MSHFCVLECREGWTQVKVNSQIKCWKHEGVHLVDQAAGVCAGLDATLPLPLSYSMQREFVENIGKFDITGNVALDATRRPAKVQGKKKSGTRYNTQGRWRDSTNR